MNKRSHADKKKHSSRRRPARMHASKPLWPALLALGGGCSLIGPVFAVELGELRVHSAVGQPLRASVAYALQPNEMLGAHCIYLTPGMSASGLPSISNANISVANGSIELRGRTVIREPLLTLQLTVDCPYTAHLRRDYAVFLSPHAPPQAAASPPASPARSVRDNRVTATAARSVRRSPDTPVSPAAAYLVQPGDTLSGIAERIDGRRVGIWEAVDALFAANPDAFVGNNRDLLRAGAELVVPEAIVSPRELAAGTGSGTTRSTTVESPPVAGQDAGASARSASAGTSPYRPEQATVPAVSSENRSGARSESAPQASQARTPRPGDVAVSSGSPFVSPIQVDNEPAARSTPAETPSAPVVQRAVPATSDSWSPLAWLGGSGLLLILALLLGRKFTDGFDASAWLRDAFGRRRSMYGNRSNGRRAAIDDEAQEGSAPVARMISLDPCASDLGDSSASIEVAEDFGFDGSGDFASDLVYGPLPSVTAPRNDSTDILPTQRIPEDTIVDSEIPPTRDDTGEYDVSMIVDATKQAADAADASTKDLRAIEVEVEADGSETGTFTLSQPSDYKILEQDYEEELSATQALNSEIARAAREMTLTFDLGSDGETSRMASMDFPGRDAESADEDTAQVPRPDEDTDVSQAVEREPAGAENDATVEMDVGRGDLDARKKRAS